MSMNREHRPGGSGARMLPVAADFGTDDGVDVPLIRWLLAMTPAERLTALQGTVDALFDLGARGGKAGFPDDH